MVMALSSQTFAMIHRGSIGASHQSGTYKLFADEANTNISIHEWQALMRRDGLVF